MKFNSLVFCLFVLFVFGCNENNSKDEKELRDFVNEWNATHTQLKASYLIRYYMDVVDYYGKERTKTQVQQDKTLLFQEFPEYTQRILNDELEVTKEAGTYLVAFTKRVNYNGIEADYTTYLSLIYKNHKFKILREGVAENSKDLDAPIFPYSRERDASITKNRRLYGDFDGDGLSDYAYVTSPELLPSEGADDEANGVRCKGECSSTITFSNSNLKAITVKGAYQSKLENLKDLNSDGADEIGFWDIKPNTKRLYVFNATDGALLCDPIVINTAVHKDLSLIDVFKKTGSNKITVTRSVQVDGKWVLESEVISLDGVRF